MTTEEFEVIDAELMKASNEVLHTRRTSYEEGGDRLANFKRIGQETGLSAEKVCEVYLHKALCSMTKLLNGQEVRGEPVVSRFSDVVNYVRLAYALVREKASTPVDSTKQISGSLPPLMQSSVYRFPTLKEVSTYTTPALNLDCAANRIVD